MNTDSPFDKDATTGTDVDGDSEEPTVDVDDTAPPVAVGDTFDELEEDDVEDGGPGEDEAE